MVQIFSKGKIKKLYFCPLMWLFLIQLYEYPYRRYYLPLCRLLAIKKSDTITALREFAVSQKRENIDTGNNQKPIQQQQHPHHPTSIFLITYSCQVLYLLFYIHYLPEFLCTNPTRRCFYSCLKHEDIAQETSMSCLWSHIQ